MTDIFGVIVLFFGLLAWIGQFIAAVSPNLAARLSLTEHKADVDPVFWADIRGEAVWDALVLWTLPIAGLLLLLGSGWWPPFGLTGGAVYVYFAGRGIATRLAMQNRNIRVGKPESGKLYFVFLTLWGSIGLVTIILAAAAFRS